MNPTVLIVDDNASLAYFTSCNLRGEIEGLDVLIAGSCREALALAKDYRPHVYIVDLKLPDGDGLELIGELKTSFPKMAPILITATPLAGVHNGNLFGLLTKPYDVERLIHLVREALEISEPGVTPTAAPYVEPPETTGRSSGMHYVQNRLSGLMAGIRALRLELYAVSDDASEVKRTADQYSDRLCSIVKDVGEALKRGGVRSDER